jgi:hypothetical protein
MSEEHTASICSAEIHRFGPRQSLLGLCDQREASEVRFQRYVKGCRKIDHLTDENMRNELGIIPKKRNI